MNILIDINHPAHVHLLRNVFFLLKEKGHEVTVVVKEIPSAMRLMDLYGIP
jgi:predicted glycosyltransferase